MFLVFCLMSLKERYYVTKNGCFRQPLLVILNEKGKRKCNYTWPKPQLMNGIGTGSGRNYASIKAKNSSSYFMKYSNTSSGASFLEVHVVDEKISRFVTYYEIISANLPIETCKEIWTQFVNQQRGDNNADSISFEVMLIN